VEVDVMLELAIVIGIIAIFDLAALRWGVDSRGSSEDRREGIL
jgi:hypothetical protein